MVANSVGVLLALFGIILTSLVGLSLVKSQGLKNLTLIKQKMANNEDPASELVTSVALLFAGFFLFIPGFLTDILGAILLLPPVQLFFVKFLVPKINMTCYQRPASNKQDDVIEGEFTHKDDE